MNFSLGSSNYLQVMQMYAQSRRLKGSNVTINSAHPGFVDTNLPHSNSNGSKLAVAAMAFSRTLRKLKKVVSIDCLDNSQMIGNILLITPYWMLIIYYIKYIQVLNYALYCIVFIFTPYRVIKSFTGALWYYCILYQISAGPRFRVRPCSSTQPPIRTSRVSTGYTMWIPNQRIRVPLQGQRLKYPLSRLCGTFKTHTIKVFITLTVTE